jgi:diguanylate cyclase (GGDEF)-like protein/PAS domain S-box-containing protein
VKASEERYRALVAASTALVWRAAPDGSVLEGWGWNDYWGEFPDEFKGHGWVEQIHPDDRDQVLSIWQGAVASGTCPPLEYRIRRIGGAYRWAHIRTVPLKNPEGSIREWVGTLTDIHERRETVAALNKSEERLRLAVESTGLGIWDHDFVSDKGWWSEGKKATLGLAEDHPIGLEVLLRLVHPDDRMSFAAAVERALRPDGHGRIDEHFRILRASDGAERWVDSVGKVFFDEQGKPVRILGTLRDITERKTAIARLRSSEERFRRVAETSPNACICIDEDGQITFWNKGAENIFGYAPTEACGRSIEIVIPERFRAAHKAGLQRAAQSQGYSGRTVELTGLHRDGHEFPVEGSLSTWMEGTRRQFGALMRDISERRRNEERLYRLAHYDHLTELPNRTLLWERLTATLSAGEPLAVLLLDLDGFKTVNDTVGHEAGDHLLKQVAERLSAAVPGQATVARVGGDEFAVSLPGACDPQQAKDIAATLQGSLAEPFTVAGRTAFLGASIGIAIAPDHGRTAQEMMGNADLALYRAKEDGRNVTRLFAPMLRAQTEERQNIEVELRRAFKNGEFELHYQPQVRLEDRRIVGAEALLRWRHPERGLLSPAAFLPVLETGPLAAAVGTWAIRKACIEAAKLRAANHAIRAGVNLFSAQFRAGDLVNVVERALADTGLAPDLLELEITETTILKSNEGMVDTLKEIRNLGVGIAFDDYGTGYASLSMLKRFPLTRLKIDRGFVQNVESDSGDIGIIQAIVQLGSTFGLEVIAEGVETERQERVVRSLGCAEAQGYLYGRAMPPQEFYDRISNADADLNARLLSAIA